MKSRQILFITLLLPALLALYAAPPAESLMTAASSKARAEGKNVFVIFSITGCAWCKVLKGFIESEDVKPIFEKHFVSVQLVLGSDTNANPGATRFEQQFGPAQGVPYHAFVTPAGQEIVDSRVDGDGPNIGYPYAPHEVEWFMAMIKKAAPKITKRELQTLESKLKRYKRAAS